MALVHINTTLKAACDVVVDLLDVGATDPDIQLTLANGSTVVATLPLDGTNAFGAATTASPSVATVTGTPEDISATGDAGPVALCIFRNSDQSETMRGSVTVTGGGGEMELTSLVIATGEKVLLTSMTYTVSDPV